MDQSTNQQTTTYGKRALWQWVVIYLIIGGIIYLGIYYFLLSKGNGYSSSQRSQSTSSQQTIPSTGSSAINESSPAVSQSENTVTLTSDGYSPATLTIKVGSTVKWVNDSGESATVNSDPHPTHTNYPPLNLGKFDNGGTLSLTFDKAGTYGYHNHLNASEKGTIIVQ
jgi:plastocyanin